PGGGRHRRAAADRRLLRARRRRAARARAHLARAPARARRRRRHGLRRPYPEGPAHAGRAAGRRDHGRRPRARRAAAPPRPARRGDLARRGARQALAVSWRDLLCGEPRPAHVGRRATLAGWAARRRDHGGLVFIDLRDHTGVTQLVVNPERAAAAADVAKEVRNEFVLQATGEVVARAPETVNPKMATGAVELHVDELRVVSRSTP